MFKTIDPEISDNNEPTAGGRRPNKPGKVPDNASKLKGDPEDDDDIDEDYFQPVEAKPKGKKPGSEPYDNARPLPFYRK